MHLFVGVLCSKPATPPHDNASGVRRHVGGGHCVWCWVCLGSACLASSLLWWHKTQCPGKIVHKSVGLTLCSSITQGLLSRWEERAGGDRPRFFPPGGPVLSFILGLPRRSGRASLYNCLQNPHFESCSHDFFLGLNAKTNSSAY